MKSKSVAEKETGGKRHNEKVKAKKIELEVTVCHFVSPSEFYLQLVKSKDELDQ
jgi:hypothetical protein